MDERRTPLYDLHVDAGAKMAPFAGFLMPIEYTGIMAEHRAVRGNMGLFDLSHMGEFLVEGEGALEAVDALVTNRVSDLEVGQIRYTPMCLEAGGIIDDLLVYRFGNHVMLVVNAANIAKDLAWAKERVGGNARVSDISDQVALIAVQGPASIDLVQGLTDTNLSRIAYYHFESGAVAGVPATISRTGYTGEDGFELYVEPGDAPAVWRQLWELGQPYGLAHVGLGARDTLRLEACLPLYGNDITESTTPLEAGLGWTVKLDNRTFTGSEALTSQKRAGVTRRLVAFRMLDRGIPRPHCRMLVDGDAVGEVTSGTFSPTFSQGIGMGYMPVENAKVATEFTVEVRERTHPAEVVKKPIYQRSSRPEEPALTTA